MNTLTIVGTIVGIVAGAVGIWSYFSKREQPQIMSPPQSTDNAGKFLTVVSRVIHRRRHSDYWIAVQPDDCRADGVWWPQTRALEFDRKGSASTRVGLGRDGRDGSLDVNKVFTVGLFEVTKDARKKFLDFAKMDAPMTLPEDCKVLHSIDVRRVRH